MVLQLVIAFVLASLFEYTELAVSKLYKTLLMFPWAMPGYVSILLWKNRHVQHTVRLAEPVDGKAGAGDYAVAILDVSAFICCTAVNLWLALPFMIMIMDGAMQSIDKKLL